MDISEQMWQRSEHKSQAASCSSGESVFSIFGVGRDVGNGWIGNDNDIVDDVIVFLLGVSIPNILAHNQKNQI